MCDGIQKVGDLFVPYSIDNTDPEQPGQIVFWGYGYATEAAAELAISRTEAGEVIPPGIAVSMESGERVGPTLADRLQRVLDARGCSVAEAARLAGVDHMVVYRIVKGVNDNPKVKTLETIVTAIGATMGELFADPE